MSENQSTLTPKMSRLIRRLLGHEMIRLGDLMAIEPDGDRVCDLELDHTLVEQTLRWLDVTPVTTAPIRNGT